MPFSQTLLISFSFRFGSKELLFTLKAIEIFALHESNLNALQEIVDMLEDFCAALYNHQGPIPA